MPDRKLAICQAVRWAALMAAPPVEKRRAAAARRRRWVNRLRVAPGKRR
jgi:hypothetical protein